MRADQDSIDRVIALYNQVTSAHKRAPVEKYVMKQLSAGETVEIVSGHPRWSSALVLSGTPDDMQAEFRVNPALPNSLKKLIVPMQEAFEKGLERL